MAWSKSHVHSTFHICWGAQAGLYYHYGIKKRILDEKLSGVFEHHLDYKNGMAIVTIVVGFTLGTTALADAAPEVLIGTMHKCFYIFIVLCVIGVFMSLKRRKE